MRWGQNGDYKTCRLVYSKYVQGGLANTSHNNIIALQKIDKLYYTDSSLESVETWYPIGQSHSFTRTFSAYVNFLCPNMDSMEWNMVGQANMEDRGSWERRGSFLGKVNAFRAASLKLWISVESFCSYLDSAKREFVMLWRETFRRKGRGSGVSNNPLTIPTLCRGWAAVNEEKARSCRYPRAGKKHGIMTAESSTLTTTLDRLHGLILGTGKTK